MAGTMNQEERAADLAANKEAMAEVSDAELFSAATTDETSEATTTEVEPKPDATGRLHAPDGRFASKSSAPTAEAAPTQQQPMEQEQVTETRDEAQVPSWRLRELREQREAAEQRAQEANRLAYQHQQQMQALQRELAELRRPKQEPVDFFQNPEAALQQSLNPLQSQFQTEVQDLRRELSEARAIAKYGMEAFDAMQTELNAAMMSNDPDIQNLRVQVFNSRDPAGVAMQWFQQRKVMREVGNDPAAYKARIMEEALKDPAHLAKAIEAARQQSSASVQNGSRPNVQLPPSLNKVAAAARTIGDDEGDLSDASLFRHATR